MFQAHYLVNGWVYRFDLIQFIQKIEQYRMAVPDRLMSYVTLKA